MYNDRLGELRFVLDDTLVLISVNDVPRDALAEVAEALRPIGEDR